MRMNSLTTTLALIAMAAGANGVAAADGETLPSGVKIAHLVPGTGASPKASDSVKEIGRAHV